jgi:threonine synthase
MSAAERQQCVKCGTVYKLDEVIYQCSCGSMLEITRDPAVFARASKDLFRSRKLSHADVDRSGVWRFRELINDAASNVAVIHPEGNTYTYFRQALADFCDTEQVWFKHEGENPTGSFKDRGMTVAVTQAKRLGASMVGCASTGNTSASLAAYAAQAGLKAVVFIPDGKIATGKLAQALGYGATCIAVSGDFDTAMNLVQQAGKDNGMYIVNSINPFRPEGQKSIIYEILETLDYDAPDWIVVPAGNLGNTSAFGKALIEMHLAGWIKRLPRIASIQATGANPFYLSYQNQFRTLTPVKAETVATAIRIGNPVNFEKAVNVIRATNGVVEQVSDQEIMAAKAAIDRSGIGCEPASASSLAGIKKLRAAGIIRKTDRVVGILTGHILKDSEAILAGTKSDVRKFSGSATDLSRLLASI